MRTLLFAALIAVSPMSLALDIPKPGRFDHRVTHVVYNPEDIVKLVAHYGYQIQIVLAEGEYVLPKSVFMGDSEAWQFGTIANNVFIKPQQENGRTNLTFITNKRDYGFELSSHWSRKGSASKDMQFKVKFRYPDDEAKRALERDAGDAARQTAAASAAALKARLDGNAPPVNFNYFVQGSEELAPDAASDDGIFTRLKFSGNRQIPAIFVVNEDGSESLINRHVEGDEVVIQALARKFVLRIGNSVACVFNESYDPKGHSTRSGATVPGIERVIKGDPQ